MNPGDSYYVTYSIRVKPEVFAKMQSDSVPIKNSFSVNSSNATQKDGANQGFIASSEITTVNLDDYKWVNKTQTEITKDTPITMSGKRYNESFVEDNEATTFTVPKDSYKYEVIVNKTHGLWDVQMLLFKIRLVQKKWFMWVMQKLALMMKKVEVI